MEKAPNSLAAANQMLTYFAEFDPTEVTHELDHAFVECATFADDVKYHGEGWQSDFHFKDTNYIEEGVESDYTIANPNPNNLLSGLYSIVAWLSGKQGTDYKTSYMYTYLMNKFANNENVAKSFALRLLIHYVGDIAEPFHSESRYNHNYLAGDKGANDFPLPYHYNVDELHALWDQVMYTERTFISRPFTAETWASFQPLVTQMMSEYAQSVQDPSVYETLDFDAMSLESYNVAKTLYDGKYFLRIFKIARSHFHNFLGVTENLAVPQAYLDKNIPVARERLNIGGYRLYYTIDFIFGDSKNVNEEELGQFTSLVKTIFGIDETRTEFLQ